MKANRNYLALGLALLAGPAYAQLPAVISAPISEKISRKQITHQAVTSVQMGTAKGLAGQMKVVSGQIKGIIDKTQQLHDTWYSSLLQISSGVRNYRRVREIYDAQAGMIQAYSTVQADLTRKGLTSAQASEAGKTYTALLTENVGLIADLVGVLSANRAKMTDPERLEFINNIADRMSGQQELFSYYTRKCEALAQQQRQASADAQSLLVLTGGK
jgi:hypothetical protein